jgi:hypothetical protein
VTIAADAQLASTLMAAFVPTSSTPRMTKWDIHGDNEHMKTLLPNFPELIEGVKFDGKVLCIAGSKPTLHPSQSCAIVENLEVKHKPSEGLLTLTFRTVWVGDGLRAGFF